MTIGDEFTGLVDTMRRLRSECPWDRSQTHDTLRAYLLEEAYEVLHALDDGRYDDLCEELGDLMLQIVFHAEIAEEHGTFTMEDVLHGITEKLVRRHPHVFGDTEAQTPADVVRNWESIKIEQENKSSSLDGVPAALPALVKAVRVLTKIRQTGVDPFHARDSVVEARQWLERLAEAAARQDPAAATRAAGMLELALVEIADRARVNPEDALRKTVARISDAFRQKERHLQEQGRTLADLSEDELNGVAASVLAACEEE